MRDPDSESALGSYLTMPLDELLEAFSAPGPPAAGTAAAVVMALSASLCTMAARGASRHMARAEEIAAAAMAIGAEMSPLCDEDSRTYLGVIAAQRLPAGPGAADRRRRISAALSEATTVPMAIVAAASRLAPLAAVLSEEGNPNLRADAVAAALLAGAGAEVAAVLVRVNLAELPDDDRPGLVATLLEDIAVCVERARRAPGGSVG